MKKIDYKKIQKDTTTTNKKKEIIKNSEDFNDIEKEIFYDLIQKIDDYKPEETFNRIKSFINAENNFNRILFSKIYGIVSSLDNNKNSIFMTNLEELLNYSKNNFKNEDNDTKKFIIKLYDRIHLSILQDAKVNDFFDENIKHAKTDLNNEVHSLQIHVKKELKSLQTQYVTILGVFASFVVTFVGGLSFSASVLNGMSTISAYRLFMVILLLGFILLTICFSLYWFMAEIIIKKDATRLMRIYKNATIIILILLISCIAFWHCGIIESRNKFITNKNIEINTLTNKVGKFAVIDVSSSSEVK